MKQLRLVLVGPGLIGKTHIGLIAANPACRLAAIVAPDRAAHHIYADSLAVPLYHDLEECLSKEKPDGVILASPNLVHAKQARSCINAGVPALVEKPFTHDVAEGYRLLDLVTRKNARVLVGHHRAHSPILAQARQVIQEGRLGRLVTVMGSAQFYKPKEYFEAGPWRMKSGGGPLLINLIHEVGNLRSLCGEIASVQAIASSSTRGFEVEDTVGIVFSFRNGVIGTFLLSDTAASAKSWEQTTGENPAYSHYGDEDCYTVAGTLGSLSIPTLRLRYYARETDPSWWNPFKHEKIAVEQLAPLRCQLDHFLEVIRGRALPLVSALDGLRNVEIVEAVRASAASRQTVPV